MQAKRLFSKKWIIATLVVLAAIAVMIGLGFWQLSRLQQRRALNAMITEQANAPALNLNQSDLNHLPASEYQQVQVYGTFDYSRQVVLRNQVWNGQLGVHLFTPLQITGSNTAVFVDRGWVPEADYEAGNISKYDISGQVQVTGIIRASQAREILGIQLESAPYNGKNGVVGYFSPNLSLISSRLSYPALPFYIQELPASSTQLPYRPEFSLQLDDGPHLSYAIQWFSFSLILGVIYGFLIMKELKQESAV